LKSKTPVSFSETYEKHRNITPIAELYKYYLEEKVLPHILEKKRKLEEKEEEKKRLREKNKFERKINAALYMF
jgi:hypothetical protein